MVYTRRLAAQELPDSGWTILYIAPDTGTVVLRDILVTNDTATLVDRFLIQVQPSTRTGSFIFARIQVPSGTTVHMTCRQVLEPREQLLVYVPVPPLSCALTGYVFQ